MSQSKMYVKSNISIDLNTCVFDWDNMTSSISIKIDDGTGIFLRTPNTIGLNSINVNVSGLTTISNNTTIYCALNISGKSQLVNYHIK
jgi:hypothetical protein